MLLYLTKRFTAELDLVSRIFTFCLFWPSHLNLKLLQKKQWAAAPHSPSLCNSILQTQPYPPWVTSSGLRRCSPLSHCLCWSSSEASSLILLVTLWIFSRSVALLFERRNWSARSMRGCPGFQTQQTSSVLQHQGKARLLKKKSWSALCSAATKILILQPSKM